MERINLEKRRMAHPLASFWDLLIESNSARPCLTDWLLT